MMFVILCNFKGGVNFDYSILVYYMFHMLYYTILCCTVYSILVYYTFTQIIISTSPCNLTFTLCVLYTKHIFLLSLYRFKLRFCSLLLRFAWWLHNIRLTTYEMQIGIRKFGWSLLFSNLLDGFTGYAGSPVAHFCEEGQFHLLWCISTTSDRKLCAHSCLVLHSFRKTQNS